MGSSRRKPAYRADAASTQRFSERYSAGEGKATVALEREVIGGDYGANGYTTLQQADVLLQRLELTPSDRLLDVGAGRGWPGLYIAKRSSCEVVLTDLPVEGLRDSRRRARKSHQRRRSHCVVASGSTLPFRPRSFDAVVHSDVLC